MTMFSKISILAIAAAALAFPSSVLDTAQQNEMVAAHNQFRRTVGAPDLRWSASVAATAQAWAETLKSKGCKMEHSKNRQGKLGENIYWASPERWSTGETEVQAITPATVVGEWAGESKNYDYRTNSCTAGKVCGHYTQVVWKSTTEIGCGKAVCGDKSQVWVCNYQPAGNIIGKKPY
jgi:pathogenesis-related protein 1